MHKRFLDDLLGPFPMSTPPIRTGFYAVELKDAPAPQFEMWFWDAAGWWDSDDGLGDRENPDLASSWWGTFPPPTETSDGLEESA